MAVDVSTESLPDSTGTNGSPSVQDNHFAAIVVFAKPDEMKRLKRRDAERRCIMDREVSRFANRSHTRRMSEKSALKVLLRRGQGDAEDMFTDRSLITNNSTSVGGPHCEFKYEVTFSRMNFDDVVEFNGKFLFRNIPCTPCDNCDKHVVEHIRWSEILMKNYISLTGSLANWLVATTTLRLPSMRNSFGRLLASQSSAEAVYCSIFAFLYSPMVFFDIVAMKRFSHRLGIVMLMCYDICIYSHLFISVNRLCAICFPFRYEQYFSKRNTVILIIISWTTAISRCLVSYGYYDCDFLYESSIWAMVYKQTKDCQFISLYVDFYKDIVVVFIIAIVDAVTIWKVRLTSKKINRAGSSAMDASRRRDINFLKQAVLQGIVFAVELYTYFHLAWQFENKWAVFGLTTVAWNLVHCVDGLIVIGFNAEFRRLLRSPKRMFHLGNTVYVDQSVATRSVQLDSVSKIDVPT